MSGNFPKDFLWGAATSAHQVEGGNLNDWSEWERHNAKRLAEEVKTRIAGELGVTEKAAEKLLPPEAYIPENYISGAAADHYHRFKEDFRNAESLGLNAIRFSIEWSRVEPMDGRFDAVQIAHYREVMRSLREHRLVPFVTLWHWTLPLWLRDKGGVMSPKFPDYFARYAAYIAAEFGNATVSTTYMSGLSNVLNGVTDPERYGEALLEQYASSLVPKIVGQTTAMFDPYKREVDGAIDTLVGLIEPVMIVVLGFGVTILLISILMPIYNLAGGGG